MTIKEALVLLNTEKCDISKLVAPYIVIHRGKINNLVKLKVVWVDINVET